VTIGDGRELAVALADIKGLTGVPAEMLIVPPVGGTAEQKRAAGVRLIAPVCVAAVLAAGVWVYRRVRGRKDGRPILAGMVLISLTLFATSTAMWVRSKQSMDVWAHHSGGTLSLVQSGAGMLRIWTDPHAAISRSAGWTYGHGPLPIRGWMGVGTGIWMARYWVICLVTMLLPLGVATMWLVRRWKAWRNPLACKRCGYDLRSSPERCPECGALAGA
jgi:hypothetical protein